MYWLINQRQILILIVPLKQDSYEISQLVAALEVPQWVIKRNHSLTAGVSFRTDLLK